MRQVFTIISLLVCTATAAVLDIPLNPQATFSREVQSIQHDTNLREITIGLKAFRRCQKPTFRIRISGTSLLMPHLKEAATNSFVYTYPHLTDEGSYFVEIIALMCAPFQPDAFINSCLEDVAEGSNVITLPYTFEVGMNETNKTSENVRPRWILPDKNKVKLLPTRYQKIGCQKEEKGWCQDSDLEQHYLYEWVDSPDYTKSLADVFSISHKDAKNKPEHTMIRVCVVGDSHARELVIQGNKLHVENVEFSYIKANYPHEFEIHSLHKRHCSYAIVTFGQWPGSMRVEHGKPYTQSKYHEEMRRVVALMQAHDANQTQVFLRSVNYTPLMAQQTSCPLGDGRIPPVIDMYNAVLRQLSQQFNIEFIDLNHIMGPMWDSAQDWNHPPYQVSTAEIKWILSVVLQSSLRRGLGVSLLAAESTDFTLVRFADSPSVYRLQNNEMRAFPNVHTFVAMGLDFADVKVYPASARKQAKFGPDLPAI